MDNEDFEGSGDFGDSEEPKGSSGAGDIGVPESPGGSGICSCGERYWDIGLEQPDQFATEKRWFHCPGCGKTWHIVIGPARVLPPRQKLSNSLMGGYRR